jgi:hypothetical protein
LEEPIVALIDHGLKKGIWPIDIECGWLVQAANNSRGDLYGAYPNLKVIIGNISDVQNFLYKIRPNIQLYLVNHLLLLHK